MALVLTTYADWSAYLGGLDAADQTRDEAILEGVEAAVLRHMRPGIVQASEVEFYDGPGESELVLRRRPVTEVASVHVDPGGAYGMTTEAFPFETKWTAGEDYASKSLEASESNPGLLIALPVYRVMSHLGWPCGRGNIRVEYTAGYGTIPAEIVLAVHQLAGIVLQSRGTSGPVKSEQIEDYSYELLSPNVARIAGADIASVRSLLAPYSRSLEQW